jgi:hypothetical protein
LDLANPVAAIRAISLDPWLHARVPLADGRNLTALEIQLLYLEECERLAQSTSLPDWSGELLGHWRQTLEALERNPLNLARRLDPYLKLSMYDHLLSKAGFTWSQLHGGLRLLRRLRETVSDPVIQALMSEEGTGVSSERELELRMARDMVRAAGPQALEHVQFSLRLQALDLQYHQLGGLYDELDDAGEVENVILTPAEIARAVKEPPSGSRAKIRGRYVTDHARQSGWYCDWRCIAHRPSQTAVDLRDPFETEVRTLPLATLAPALASFPAL